MLITYFFLLYLYSTLYSAKQENNDSMLQTEFSSALKKTTVNNDESAEISSLLIRFGSI